MSYNLTQPTSVWIVNSSKGREEYRSHEEVIKYQNYYFLYYLDNQIEKMIYKTKLILMTKTNSNTRVLIKSSTRV